MDVNVLQELFLKLIKKLIIFFIKSIFNFILILMSSFHTFYIKPNKLSRLTYLPHKIL